MTTQTRYAKIIDGRPDFAGEVITLPDGRKVANPKEPHLLAAGYHPVPDDIAPPTPPDGKVARLTNWAVVEGYAVPLYEFVDAPPPPPRRWTRLSIKTALAQAGMLAAARTFLSATEIATGYTAWEALTDCDYIEEGYPTTAQWGAMLDGAADALGKSREEIDAFLDTIPTEGA